ncbi:hypothetical protein [Streptomyces sp. NBC_01233]|uniref:hypothetical protein n=1 Tax=Streptomyces sp. NBC_01233 TaxID=2903787 RepID=UPI002E10277A|nr:hypothetical protein OG332_37030 [Streptomyces sp. NBC_01233]
MKLKRLVATAGAALLTALVLPADAHAAAVACGGGVSTQNIGARGCISAERWNDGRIYWRDITAHALLTNSRAHASWVEYEAYSTTDGSYWDKMGSGRIIVERRSTIGPIAIASTTRLCDTTKVTIRVHVRPAGGAWSNWSSAATSQCQT